MIFLVGIALADGNFSSAERTAIFRLSDLLRLPRREVEQLISMVTAQSQFQHGGYRRSSGAGITALQVAAPQSWKRLMKRLASSKATDAEVKRRYRKLMSEHHPDKLIAEGAR